MLCVPIRTQVDHLCARGQVAVAFMYNSAHWFDGKALMGTMVNGWLSEAM